MATRRQPSAEVLRGIQAHRGRPPSEDALARVRDRVRQTVDLEMQIEDLEQRLAEKREQLNQIRHGELPTLFEEVGIDRLGLDASGNVPAYDAELSPYYHANLKPENMPEAFRKFRWLEPMQKHTVKVEFGRGESAVAKKFIASLKKQRLDYSNAVGVPWNTLTAEIRRRHEDGEPLSPADLEILGATVGRVVKLKKRKQ